MWMFCVYFIYQPLEVVSPAALWSIAYLYYVTMFSYTKHSYVLLVVYNMNENKK